MKYSLNSLIALISFSCLFCLSCGKDDSNSTPDCETNNYGILKVSFGAANIQHSILVTYPNATMREKIVPVGEASDTLRLSFGNYPGVSVSSLNTSNLAIDQQTFPGFAILQCQERNIQVSF